MNDLVLGYVAVITAAVFFGSFGLPIRSERIQALQLDPMVFQLYFSTSVFLSSWIGVLFDSFAISPWGIVGAAIFVPIMLLIFVAISNLGLALPVAVWAGITVNVSFLWGWIVFNEPIGNWPMAIVALVLLCSGIVGLCLSSYTMRMNLPESLHVLYTLPFFKPKQAREPVEFTSDSVRNEEDACGEEEEKKEVFTTREWVVGLSCAISIGVMNGSLMVPAKYSGEDYSDMQYFVSFAVGIMFITLFFMAFYLWYCIIMSKEMPEFHVKEAAIPGLLSGLVWNVGNFSAIYATKYLGLTIGFPLTQTSLLVSGLWGLLFFKELTDRVRIGAFFLSAIVLLIGAFVLSIFGNAT